MDLPALPALAAYVLLLGALVVGTLFRPAVAVAGVICLFGLKQWGQVAHPFLLAHPLFSNYAIGALVLVGVAMRFAAGQCPWCDAPRAWWTALGLYAYALLSVLWTPRLDLVLPVWEQVYPYIVTAVVLAPMLLPSASTVRTALRWSVGIGAALLLLLLVFGDWGYRGLMIGTSDPELEANPLALSGLAGAVATAAMFIRLGLPRSLDWLVRMAVIVLCLVVIVRSGSRGQLIATVLSIVSLLPLGFRVGEWRGVAAIAVALTVLAGGLAWALAEYVQWFDLRWTESLVRSDAEGRLEMAMALLDRWAGSPISVLFGLGNSASFDPRIIGFYSHVVPLEVVGELGLVGLSIYLLVLWQAASSLRSAIRLAGDDAEARGLAAAAGAGLLFFFMLTLKEGSLIGSVFFFLYVAMVGRLGMPVADPALESLRTESLEESTTAPFPNVLR
jgi:hypothetical protein